MLYFERAAAIVLSVGWTHPMFLLASCKGYVMTSDKSSWVVRFAESRRAPRSHLMHRWQGLLASAHRASGPDVHAWQVTRAVGAVCVAGSARR